MADAAPLASLPAAEGNEVEVLRRWRRSREEAMQLWAAEMLGWNGRELWEVGFLIGFVGVGNWKGAYYVYVYIVMILFFYLYIYLWHRVVLIVYILETMTSVW